MEEVAPEYDVVVLGTGLQLPHYGFAASTSS